MIKYQQLKLYPGYTMDTIRERIAKTFHIPQNSIKELAIIRESIDARKKPHIFYILSVVFSCDKEEMLLKKYGKKADISFYREKKTEIPFIPGEHIKEQPIVVGAGPAGLFACYYLAKAGLKPVLLERGKNVEDRMKDVDRFWETGRLDTESNVQFGEGGAGTFSDGKLNTSNKDPLGYQKEVLRLFVEMGADSSILYEQRPHLGTDRLISIVKKLRKEIIRLGGIVRFQAKVTDLLWEEGKGNGDKKERGQQIKGVVINGEETIFSRHVILAIGHSARDTFDVLLKRNFAMEAKAFAVGYRVQHPQEKIDTSQYGAENLGKFPPASYKLTGKAADGRSVYSFCMCPGGYVVNSSSEEGRLCINGMSYSRRAGKNANSAIVVSVTPEDYENDGPLGGMEFQRKLEEKAYNAGEGSIPVQRFEDFVKDRPGKGIGRAEVFFKGKYKSANLRGILPEALEKAFVEGMEQFGRKVPDFDHNDVILSGIEARTSSPVRILRNESYQAPHMKGVYPCGEGAGYAGGITSAAMDGLRIALAVINGFETLS